MKRFSLSLVALVPIATALGCSNVAQSPAITETDVELARRPHWIDQPATETVVHNDYDQLWEACVGAARWRGFRVERLDYRGGVLVTQPLVSKQAFEVWRRDVVDLPDLAESTLASIRRVVRFEITKRDDGAFECTPKVLVERYAYGERRITTVVQYRETFSIETAQGNKERDKGVSIPEAYWYTTGRDEALERVLAGGVRSRVVGGGGTGGNSETVASR